MNNQSETVKKIFEWLDNNLYCETEPTTGKEILEIDYHEYNEFRNKCLETQVILDAIDTEELHKIIANFHEAWMFLNEHKMFHGLFECGLYTAVVKVNPETMEIDDDSTKNTKVQVWLEHGPYEKVEDSFPQHTHDWELDCGGNTFEEAIIKLAKLVKEHYNDDGTHK